MTSIERTEEIIKSLYNAVIDMDEDRVKELSLLVLSEKVDVRRVMMEGLMAAMEKVGQLYADKEYFIPEFLSCADALYAGLGVLRPHLAITGTEKQRQMIIGTVVGDIHDVGKNIVKLIFEASGWIVHDLGIDVAPSRFVEAQTQFHADIVALSALMTTSLLAMSKTIETIKGEHPDAVIIVGGAPLTREIAYHYGADGYADAPDALREVNAILNRLE